MSLSFRDLPRSTRSSSSDQAGCSCRPRNRAAVRARVSRLRSSRPANTERAASADARWMASRACTGSPGNGFLARSTMFRTDPQHVPMRRRGIQIRPAVGRVSLGEVTECRCSDQDPVTLDQGEIRGDDDVGVCQDVSHLGSRVLAQEPRQDGTGFRIDIHRSPRSVSRSWADRPCGNRFGRAGYSSASFGAPTVTSPSLASATNPDGIPSFAPDCPGGFSSATTSPRLVTSTPWPRADLPHVLAQPVLQLSEPHSLHDSYVAS